MTKYKVGMARDWGGKVMTIKFVQIDPHREIEVYRMEEGYDYSAKRKGWFWYEDMIEGLVARIDISADELLDFIGAKSELPKKEPTVQHTPL